MGGVGDARARRFGAFRRRQELGVRTVNLAREAETDADDCSLLGPLRSGGGCAHPNPLRCRGRSPGRRQPVSRPPLCSGVIWVRGGQPGVRAARSVRTRRWKTVLGRVRRAWSESRAPGVETASRADPRGVEGNQGSRG